MFAGSAQHDLTTSKEVRKERQMELTEGEKRVGLHEEEYHHAHQIDHDEEGYRHAYRREPLAKAPAWKKSVDMGYGLLGNRSSVDDNIIRQRSPAELKALAFLAQQARTGLGADPRVSKKESERLLRRDPKLRKMMRNHRVAPGVRHHCDQQAKSCT